VAVARAEAPPPPFGVAVVSLEPFLRARHAGLFDRLRWISFRFGAQGPSLLESLKPLLAARRPVLRIAVGRGARRSERQALLSYLADLGYRVERFGGDATHAEPVTVAEAKRWKRLDLLAIP
jgi:hypothetical protein